MSVLLVTVLSISVLSVVTGDIFSKPKNCSTDVAIAEGIISSHQVANIATCQKKCEDDPSCMGFNYEVRSAKKCTLNSDIAGPEGHQLSYKPTFSYTEKLDDSAVSFKASSCSNYEACRPVDYVGTYERMLHRDSTYGWWGMDCSPTATDDFFYDMKEYSNRNQLLEFSSQQNYVNNYIYRTITLPFGCSGANHIVYKRVFYCGGYNANEIYTYDLDTNTQLTTISFANVEGKVSSRHDQCSYNWNGYSDLDMASDEQGLWVLWGRVHENCAFAISKIDHETKTIVRTWFPPNDINFDKNDYGNAFMVCGNMYVMNHHHHSNTYVRWIYYTGNSSWVEVSGSDPDRIILQNVNVYNCYLNYSPRDHYLYSWEHAYHNRYKVHFRDWET